VDDVARRKAVDEMERGRLGRRKKRALVVTCAVLRIQGVEHRCSVLRDGVQDARVDDCQRVLQRLSGSQAQEQGLSAGHRELPLRAEKPAERDGVDVERGVGRWRSVAAMEVSRLKQS
jgi:hypothetical protein